MARVIVWTCAALLFAGTAAPEAAACEAAQQRPTSKTTYSRTEQDKNDKRTGPSSSDREGPKKWWIDATLRNELGITDQQSVAIEQVWQKSLAHRAETRERLEKLEATLQKMILEAADEAAVIAHLDRVEIARSDASKARVLLLYRMHRLLTQEQRAKLDARAKAMRDRDGRRGGPRPR